MVSARLLIDAREEEAEGDRNGEGEAAAVGGVCSQRRCRCWGDIWACAADASKEMNPACQAPTEPPRAPGKATNSRASPLGQLAD